MDSFGNGLCLFLNMSFVCYEIEFRLFSTVFFINLKFICFFKNKFLLYIQENFQNFFSLNRVAQVGLRQQFKNVLLNHLNNSEVSEGESGVVSSKKLSTEPKICAKGDKKILVSQFPPRSHPESDDSC